MESTLDIILIALLGATLFQAVRLERALGMLKRDRASLEALVAGFNASTNQAENGIARLRVAADGAGRQIEGQITKSTELKDDLAYLSERGDRLADRLETLVRAARPITSERPVAQPESSFPKAVSQVERDLLKTLRMAR